MTPMLAAHAERRLPRYTSYPTAPHFDAGVDGAVQAVWLGALDPARPLSLYLHVPFCRQVCWYCACNMKLARRDQPVLDYAAALEQEVRLVAGHLPGRLAVQHIHWGGGTPTAMPMAALARLTRVLRRSFDVLPGAETAFEIDPRTFEPAMAQELAALGTTRASLGVQEFDDRVQRAVNRVQPFETVREVVLALRRAGVDALNFDLMYGLPYQTVKTLSTTVERALTLAPDRIALFGYAHVPWMAKRQRMLPEEALPGADERFAQAEAAAGLLVEAGYVRIGLDHFARPDDRLATAAAEGRLRRNFQGYTDDTAAALIGFGATAISALPGGYAQNISEAGAWARAIAEGHLPVARGRPLTPEDRLRRAVIERLMCDLSVDLDAVATGHGRPTGGFAPERAALARLAAEGLVVLDGARVRVPEAARPALRVVASSFDAYLTGEGAARHAAAI